MVVKLLLITVKKLPERGKVPCFSNYKHKQNNNNVPKTTTPGAVSPQAVSARPSPACSSR